MKIIELDLTGCKNIFDIHKRIRFAFEFPEWYGESWDAFWDLIWSDCDADRLIIKGEYSLPSTLGEDISKMHKLLDRMVNFTKEHDPFEYIVVS